MIDPGFEFRHLRYFLAVAETQNISRAAERLGVSQPSISQQIKDLEAALGAPLFHRIGKRIRLTPMGQAFREQAQLVLRKVEDALEIELDEPDAEPVLARFGNVLDELRLDEGPELARHRARRRTGAPGDLVRAELAVEDLVRAGGFDRGYLMVATTTGRGWVDPASVDTFEYLTGGDTATVTMQYSYLPSWLSYLVDQDRARDAGRELFDAVYARTRSYLAHLKDDDLDRVVDERWDPPVTLGVRLVSVLDDDVQHAGQAAYVRGLLPE